MYTLHKGQKGLLISNSIFVPFTWMQQSDASGGEVSDSQVPPTVSDSGSLSVSISLSASLSLSPHTSATPSLNPHTSATA